MADRESDDAIDQLLDSVLSQYSSVEPRPGLETRILASIADSRSAISSRHSILRWAWAAGIAAAFAAIAVFSLLSRPTPRAPQSSHAAQTRTQPAVEAPVVQVRHPQDDLRQVRAAHPRSATVRRARAIDVRQEIFPTPVPLSEQEVLLLQYLSQTPRQEKLAQSHPDPWPDVGALEDGAGSFPRVSNQRFSNQ